MSPETKTGGKPMKVTAESFAKKVSGFREHKHTRITARVTLANGKVFLLGILCPMWSQYRTGPSLINLADLVASMVPGVHTVGLASCCSYPYSEED